MAKYRVGIFTIPNCFADSDTVDFEFPDFEQAIKFVANMVMQHNKCVYIEKDGE